jgi:hypothetical protein
MDVVGGPQSRSGRFGDEKILDPSGTRTPDPSVVQPVASRYTDYAIPAHTVHSSHAKSGATALSLQVAASLMDFTAVVAPPTMTLGLCLQGVCKFCSYLALVCLSRAGMQLLFQFGPLFRTIILMSASIYFLVAMVYQISVFAVSCSRPLFEEIQYLMEYCVVSQGNGPIRHVETCHDFFFHCRSIHNKIHCQNSSY